MLSEQIVSILDLLNSYPFLISFLPVIFGGEVAIITLAFLSQQNLISIGYVILFGLIGAILSDLLWYSLTKLRLVRKFKEWRHIKKHYENIEKKIEKISRGKDFLMLLIAKFVVGTRVVTIIYLNLRNIKLSKFVVYSIVANFIWLGAMITFGVLAGRGFVALGLFDRIQWIILGVVVLIVAWHFIEKAITKKFVGPNFESA